MAIRSDEEQRLKRHLSNLFTVAIHIIIWELKLNFLVCNV